MHPIGRLALFAMALASALPAATLQRGPYLQRVATGEITVCWRSDVAQTGTVRYGTSPLVLTNLQSSAVVATNHAVRIAGLQPATTYYYAVEQEGQTLASGANLFFRTAPGPAYGPSVRIWILGDSGTANAYAKGVYDAYRSFAGSRHTDLMLMLGDNAYTTGTDAQYQTAVFAMYPEILRQTPLFSCFGNHDGYADPGMTQGEPYYDIFTFPAAGECGGVPSGSEAYFSFDYGGIHFVSLDSAETLRTTNGAMHAWLEQDLAANTSRWTIALWHHAPYTKGSHDSDDEAYLVQMRQNFLPLIEAAGVDLVLSGHSHDYERSFLLQGHYGMSATFDPLLHAVDGGDGDPLGDGAYVKSGTPGTVYVVAGSGGQLGGVQADFPHPAMAVSRVERGSLVLDIEPERLDAIFLNIDGAVRDRFSILKPELRFAGIAATNAGVSLQWYSRPGGSYALWRAANLQSNEWVMATNGIPATAPVNTLLLGGESHPSAFYRVEVEAP